VYRKLLGFFAAQSAEKTIRFRQYLERVHMAASAPERELTSLFNEWFLSAETRILRAARIAAGKTEPAMETGGSGIDWERGEEDEKISLCIRYLCGLGALRSELAAMLDTARYLPKPKLAPQAYVFLRELFGSLFDEQVVVVLVNDTGPDYSSQENYPEQTGSLESTRAYYLVRERVLPLSYMDFNNPLMWASLAHGYGHYLFSRERLQEHLYQQVSTFYREMGAGVQLNKEAVPGRGASSSGKQSPTGKVRDFGGASIRPSTLVRWTAELFADMVALEILGPGYYTALASTFVMQPDELGAGSALAPELRLELLHKRLAERELCDETVDEYHDLVVAVVNLPAEVATSVYSTSFGLRAGESGIPRGSVYAWLDSLLSMVDEEIDRLQLRRFDRGSMLTANRLVGRLQKGIPVGSRKRAGEVDVSVSEMRDALEKGEIDIYKALKLVEEVPNTVPEIICAGWKNWRAALKEFEQALVAAEDGTVFNEIKNTIDFYDGLLLKSIQSSAVHRFYTES